MIDYREAGVDVEEGYRAVTGYKEHAKRTMVPGVLNGLGVSPACSRYPPDTASRLSFREPTASAPN